jgi:ATP-binding cassette subfamily F protein uup
MEQREYEQIEQRIAEAEVEVSRGEAALSDPKVMADHARMIKACEVLGAAQDKVAALYARWEELEAKRG